MGVGELANALVDKLAGNRKLRLLPSVEMRRPPHKRGSSEEGAALKLLEERVPRRSESTDRIAHEANWTASAAFFGNKQHFSMLGNQIVDIPPDELEIRYLCNMILPYVLRATAKVEAVHGRFACKPASSSTRDLEIARTSMAVWRHIRDAVDYDSEKSLALLWAAICGTAFYKNVFDPAAGDIDRFYMTSEEDSTVLSVQLMSEADRQYRDKTQLFDDLPAGELSCEAVSPFQVWPDRASKRSLKHCRHISQHQWIPLSVVAEAFGVDEKDMKAEGQSSSGLRYEEAIANMAPGMGWSGSNPTSEDYSQKTYLTQSWERPSIDYPRGRYLAAGGGRVLRDMANPYVSGRTNAAHLPWTKLDWTTMPGRFWGIGLVELLRSIQFRRNESRARMHEFENVFGQPATFMPKGAEVSPNMMTTKPGALIEYNPVNGTPTTGPKPELPSEVLMNAQTCDQEMARIASLSDIDTGKAPGQIRSSDGLQTLFEDRDMALTHTMSNALRADRENGRQHLAIAQVFYPSERVATFRGPNGQWAAQQFTSADLNNDIISLGEPGEFETTASERRGIMQAVQAGGLQPQTNPQHAQMFVKALKYGTSEELVEDILQHELRQDREIREIIGLSRLDDAAYPVSPWEDDAAHMRVLVRFFHKDEFDRLDDAAKLALGVHYSLHEQQASKKMKAQLELMALTQSTPATKGVASQAKAG